MSAFEPPHHQRSFSYPNPSLPPFSNLYSSPGQMYSTPPKRQSTMSTVNPLQPVSTTLPLLTPMDFSRYTTVFNNTPTYIGPQISHDRFQPMDGTDTPQTQHATLPSTPTEPTSAPADRTNFMDAYMNFGSKSQDLMWQPEETREFITPSRIGQGFAPMSMTNELPIEAFPRSHPYTQPQQEYMAMNMMRFEQDDEEVAREAHLNKTRKHVCPVCSKRFNRPSSLNTHMAVHTGAKPFQCSKAECGRRFSVSSNLRRHEKTHSQGRTIRRGHSSPIDEAPEEPTSRHQLSSSWGSAHSLDQLETASRPQSEQSSSAQPFVFGDQVYPTYNGSFDEYPYAQPPVEEGQYVPGDLGQYQVTREGREAGTSGGLQPLMG